jgi:hypothetical protein
MNIMRGLRNYVLVALNINFLSNFSFNNSMRDLIFKI